MIVATPGTSIDDYTYGFSWLGARMCEWGSQRIVQHRSKRVRKKNQAGRRLRLNKRRWIIEGFFAGIPWQRQLLVRWGYHPGTFLTFVQDVGRNILLKRVRDGF